MPFSICITPVSPMRAEPAHRSEQTSQLLFGETCEVLETTKDFTKIKCTYDSYEGWCQSNQLVEIDNIDLNKTPSTLLIDWSSNIIINGQPMKIPFGSDLTFLETNPNNYNIKFTGNKWTIGQEETNEALLKRLAFTYLNTSYLWGGRSVFGVDCSGFCQVVFKFLGIQLHRDAYQQATQGEPLGFVQEAKCGDLAFFDNDEGRITHVGIMLNATTIIHSSGRVRVDTIDHSGITNVDTGVRTHRLRIIKRILP